MNSAYVELQQRLQELVGNAFVDGSAKARIREHQLVVAGAAQLLQECGMAVPLANCSIEYAYDGSQLPRVEWVQYDKYVALCGHEHIYNSLPQTPPLLLIPVTAANLARVLEQLMAYEGDEDVDLY